MTSEPPLPFHEVPRAAGHWPVLGHALSLSRDLPGFMRALSSGPSRLQQLRLPGGLDMVVWADPESFELFNDKSSSSAHQVQTSDVVTGHTSMLSSDGAEHRHRRKASGRPFTPRGLTMSGVSAVITEVVEEHAARMVKAPGLVLLEECQIVALDIIFRVMGIPREELDTWAQKYATMLKAAIGLKWDFPGSPHRRALNARAWIDERLMRHVERARQDPEKSGLVAELVRGRDDEGQALTEQEILDNLRLMIFAGHETTASTVAWMLSYAATRPELQEELMAEAISGERLPQTPKEMGAFPKTEALFRECLRLHPPVTLSSRLTTEAMVIEGYAIPAGTVVGIPIWLFGRDASMYPDPEAFRLDRWLGERRARTQIENSVFGGGPHFCLGYHMAWLEAVQFTVALLRALHGAGLRVTMPALPGESYIPLLRPRLKDTRCVFVQGLGG